METVPYSAFCDGLRGCMDRARDGAEPILVTAEDPSANVIMINARDYGNMLENLYVLSDSEPRKNLTRACCSSSGAGFGCAS